MQEISKHVANRWDFTIQHVLGHLLPSDWEHGNFWLHRKVENVLLNKPLRVNQNCGFGRIIDEICWNIVKLLTSKSSWHHFPPVKAFSSEGPLRPAYFPRINLPSISLFYNHKEGSGDMMVDGDKWTIYTADLTNFWPLRALSKTGAISPAPRQWSLTFSLFNEHLACFMS